jgi:hypothetical protein
MEINLKATYQLNDEQIKALFWTALTSGSIGYGMVQLDCTTSKAYEEARECAKILKAGSVEKYVEGDYYLCSEDVLTEVFMAGNLIVQEHDGFDDHTTSTPVQLEDLYHNLDKMQEDAAWILEEFARGDDDSDTHDSFLQCLLLGEIVYG